MDSANNGAALRKAVRFRFGGETVALDRFSPRATVLDWLRESVGAKGTKEGCAEGDCGACTVVLVRNRNGRLTYDAVNACILLLGQLDGAELITVEDLAEGERASSGAAGDGRPSRVAMRLLHPRNRHEPVRRLPLRRPLDESEPLRSARRQSLPLHGLPTDPRSGARNMRRSARRPFCRDRGDAVGGAGST